MNIAEIREKYPQYNDLSDEELAKGLHAKFYSDMDFGEFSNKIGLAPQLNLTEEQKAQIKANRDEYERKQAERDKDQWFVSLVENKQDDPLKNIARSTARVGLSTMQGIANAGLNPFTDTAKEYGADLTPIKPENMAERTAELAGEYGYDAAVLYALGLGAGSLYPKLAPYTAPLTLGGFPLAMGQSLGSSLATGMIDPESTAGRIATDIIGGGLGAGLARPRVSMPKETKAISELEKTVGKDVLAENVAEAERTGRNLLEVGSDEITQRALQAKLQTPEARKILLDSIEQSSASQPERTKAVINEALGTEGKNATLSQVMENARAEAQPIYKELEDIGDLAAYETKDIPEQNFKRWFEGSQVVDESGQPLKLYHGTSSKFDKFKKGNIFFVNDKGIAEQYGSEDAIEAYLKMKNPYVIDAYGQSFDEIYNAAGRKKAYKDLTETDYKKLADTFFDGDIQEAKEWYPRNEQGEVNLARAYGDKARSTNEWADWAKKQGYDGVIIKDVNDTPDISNTRATDYVVFEPNQIKSVNNSGAWSSSPSLSDVGWKPESQLAGVIKDNPFIQSEIANVRKDLSLPKNVRESSDTSFSILNAVKKNIDDKINVAKRGGENELAARLTGIKNELKNKIDDATGGKYSKALGIYEDAFRFRDASDLGRDVFNSRVSPDDMKVKIGALTANEKKAARIGLREEILNKVGSTNNQTNALNKLLPENVREKITTLAGEKEGAKIIDEAEQAVKLRNNLNKVFSGSQTAEKGVLERAIAGVMNFKAHPVLSTLSGVYTPYNRGINIRAAETLTDKNIADAYRNVMNARNAPKQPKGFVQSGLRSIIERLTEENN